MFSEFKKFVLRGNVLDLAVGVVIGAAFGKIVNAFVAGIFDPLIALFGETGLRDLSFAIGTRTVNGRIGPNAFMYGAILDAAISFLLVAAAVFFLVVKPANRLTARMRPDEEEATPTHACPHCLSSIPRKATRCAHCTQEVPALD